MKSIFRIIAILFVILGLTACSDLIEQPFSSITTASFYTTEEDANAAITGIYKAWADHEQLSKACILITPEMYMSYRRAHIEGLYKTCTYPFTDPRIRNMWRDHYIVINSCNDAIKNIPRVEMDPVERNGLVAEARWMRAWMFFNLVRLWGDVPARTEPFESLNQAFIPGTPVADIYNDIIIPDLVFAKEHLPLTRPRDGRVKRGAALFLLGKVYLTMGRNPLNDTSKLPLARAELQDLINNQATYGYRLLPNFVDVFPINSLERTELDVSKELNEEIIFAEQHTRAVPGHPTRFFIWYLPNQSMFVDMSNGGINQGGYLEEFYYNLHDETDERRDVTMVYSYRDRRNPNNFITWMQPTNPGYGNANYNVPARSTWGLSQGKYIDPGMTSNVTGSPDLIWFRLADAYLMLAEAENLINGGPNSLVFDNIDAIRLRAKASPVDRTSAWTVKSMDDYIYEERQKELAFEFHGPFDLRRFNKLKESFERGFWWNATSTYSPHMELLPIPAEEMERNPAMVQNPGW